MKIIVKAKPGAKEEKIKEIAGGIGGDRIFEVSVKEPPVQGESQHINQQSFDHIFWRLKFASPPHFRLHFPPKNL